MYIVCRIIVGLSFSLRIRVGMLLTHISHSNYFLVILLQVFCITYAVYLWIFFLYCRNHITLFCFYVTAIIIVILVFPSPFMRTLIPSYLKVGRLLSLC